MVTETDEHALATRRLILRDSLAFLSLVLVTLVLFGVTLLLFRSFTSHRDELAKRWSQRGVQAMQSNRAPEAVVALRTALSYAPDTRSYELLLAQALAQAGRVNESYNYFMGLWATQPGDGFINLQLARLAAERDSFPDAVKFYRASVYGTWEGDGVARRAQVRLELARYFIQQGRYNAARTELLIAGGNSPETPALDQTLGDLLEQAQDPADAWTFYNKALRGMPRDVALLEHAGQLAFQAARYDQARRLLTRAEAIRAEQKLPANPATAALRDQANRMVELDPVQSLPNNERARRVYADRAIAKKRLDACVAKFSAAATPLPATVTAIVARWSSPEAAASLAALRRDPSLQDAALSLLDDTEIATAQGCEPATGDDALLLTLAKLHGASQEAGAAPQPPAAPAQSPATQPPQPSAQKGNAKH